MDSKEFDVLRDIDKHLANIENIQNNNQKMLKVINHSANLINNHMVKDLIHTQFDMNYYLKLINGNIESTF